MSDADQIAEFDHWAASYDNSIQENSGFPFEGYSAVLHKIVELSGLQPQEDVLDLGIGTGNLALLFYRKGCNIWGLDFSAKMLMEAQAKIPTAVLGQIDIRKDWPAPFERHFDCIVSAYTFHHFPLEEKVALVKQLLDKHLPPKGRLIIGDIAFEDEKEENILRKELGSDWEQECYWLVDETLAAFRKTKVDIRFVKISSCAGVFLFWRQTIKNPAGAPHLSISSPRQS